MMAAPTTAASGASALAMNRRRWNAGSAASGVATYVAFPWRRTRGSTSGVQEVDQEVDDDEGDDEDERHPLDDGEVPRADGLDEQGARGR